MAKKKKAAAKPESSSPPGELPGGYQLEVRPDMGYKLRNADGKVLSSVPDKVRKSAAWKQFMALRANHRLRLKDNMRAIVDWMVSGEAIDATILAALMKDPAWRIPLMGLVVVAGLESGFILGGDDDKGLGVFTRDLDSVWIKEKTWKILHPSNMDDLAAWQECAADNGQRQGTPQLTRSLYKPGDKELISRSTGRFSGKTLDNAARSSHGFNGRGWATSSGDASRKLVVYRSNQEAVRVTAEFNYFVHGDDYGDWNTECETGDLRFLDDKGDPMQLRDVPPAIFSEACLDVDAIVAAG